MLGLLALDLALRSVVPKVGIDVGGQRFFVALLDVVFESMDRLLVLSEVVQAREVLVAVGARKGSFARVFTAVAGQVLQAGKRLVAVWEPRALEHPSLGGSLLLLFGHPEGL